MFIRLLTYFFIYLIILHLTTDLALASGKATSMGLLTSIASDGPFDVVRNPALLTLQKKNNSTGIFSSFTSHHTSYSSTLNNIYSYNSYMSSNEIIDFQMYNNFGKPDLYSMNIQLAYTAVIGKSFFGLSLTGIESEIYTSSKRRYMSVSNVTMTEQNSLNTTSAQELVHAIEKIKGLAPSFISAVGYNITKKNSIGFQLSLGYLQKEMEIITNSISITESNEYYEETKIQKDTYAYSAEMGFGYLYKESGTHVGILLRSGDFTLKREEMEFSKSSTYSIYPDSSPFGKSDYSYIGRYTKGAALSAGCYKRINPLFAIAIEGTLKFENVYNDKGLEFSDIYTPSIVNASSYITEESYYQKTKNSIFIKGGVEFNPISRLAFLLGMGYTSYNNERYRNDNTYYTDETLSDSQTDYYLFTSGIDFRLSSNLKLNLISVLINYNNTTHIRIRNEYMILRMKDHVHGYMIELGLGITSSI
ncbi:MAG: hypothetical protein SVZ03_09265 [Spirochaetota bacterium]|nr:hypothetical protein [Spirochaetota bacterium]